MLEKGSACKGFLVAILKPKGAKVVFARALLLQQGATRPIEQYKLLAICEFKRR